MIKESKKKEEDYRIKTQNSYTPLKLHYLRTSRQRVNSLQFPLLVKQL
jgi:hypothetical protein